MKAFTNPAAHPSLPSSLPACLAAKNGHSNRTIEAFGPLLRLPLAVASARVGGDQGAPCGRELNKPKCSAAARRCMPR